MNRDGTLICFYVFKGPFKNSFDITQILDEALFLAKKLSCFPSFLNLLVGLIAGEGVWVSPGTHTSGLPLLWNPCVLLVSSADWGELDAFIAYHETFPKTFFFFF